jgi:hypothetical protein
MANTFKRSWHERQTRNSSFIRITGEETQNSLPDIEDSKSGGLSFHTSPMKQYDNRRHIEKVQNTINDFF